MNQLDEGCSVLKIWPKITVAVTILFGKIDVMNSMSWLLLGSWSLRIIIV